MSVVDNYAAELNTPNGLVFTRDMATIETFKISIPRRDTPFQQD